MSLLTIQEHSSTKYSPRTYANAKVADLTVAFAVNFDTAGEKCTHKAAGAEYAAFPLKFNPSSLDQARYLWKYCKHYKVETLNIAGNGIQTLMSFDWDQVRINQYIYEVIKHVRPHHPISKIVSGGQTGVDLAGLVAAYKLGIPCVGTLPKGFMQRDAFGRDRWYTEEQIVNDIIGYSKGLR